MIITRGFITGNMCTHGYGGTTDKVYSDCIFLAFTLNALDTNILFTHTSSSNITNVQYMESSTNLLTLQTNIVFKKLQISIELQCQ